MNFESHLSTFEKQLLPNQPIVLMPAFLVTKSSALLPSRDKWNWIFKSKLIPNEVFHHRYFKATCKREGKFPISEGVWEEKKNSGRFQHFWQQFWAPPRKKQLKRIENAAQVKQAKGVNYSKYSLSYSYRNLLQGYQNIYLVQISINVYLEA